MRLTRTSGIDLYQMACISHSAPQQRPLRQIRQERGGGEGPRLPYKQERKQQEQGRQDAEDGRRRPEKGAIMKKKELIERIAQEAEVPTGEA